VQRPVLLDVENGIALVTLNRPGRHNAIDHALLGCLYECIETIGRQKDIRAAIITGSGKSFCSGIDLDAVRDENLFDPATPGNDLPDAFRACAKPIIGAVNGHAITGGFEIALNCDFLIASEKAVFIDSHAKLGIHPGWGMTQLLQQAVGPRRAKQISLTGQPVSAHQALAWGLVNEVVSHEALLMRTRQIAADICDAQTDTRQVIKKLIELSNALSLDEGLEKEREGFRSFGRADFKR
jgi:enoyl-CoA hydratase